MKYSFYFLSFLLLLTIGNVTAQCPVGTAYYWNTSNPVTMNVPSPVNNTWKQNIIYVNVVAGNTYQVGNCPAVNGTNPAAAGGTSVTVRQPNGGAVIASASGPADICATFVAPSTGPVWAYFYTDACATGTTFFTSGAVWTAPACPAPTGLTASGITTTSANLAWTAPTGATGYQWAITPAAAPPASGTGITPAAYNAGGLTPNTTYYFHVRNVCGASSFSNWVTISFTTLPLCQPPAPPTISGITTTGATANWGAAAGSTGYEWFVSTSATPPASGTFTSNTSQPITGLTVGTQYYFHLRNACSGGLFSSWVSTSFSTPCNPVTGLSVSNPSFNGATLNWTAVPGSAGYEWVVTTSPTPPASGTASSTTTVNATGLLGGTLYYVHVRNNCGAAGFSGWTTTTFTTNSSCTSPSNILVTNIGSTTADIQWDPITGAIGFEYLVDNTPQAPSTSGAPIAFNNYSPANLVSATRYYVHLRTNCGPGGFSPWVTVQFTTDTLCFAPVPVISNITGTTADIIWLPEANATNYQYLVSASITPPFSGYATTGTSYNPKGLQKNTQYYIHLRSYCGGNDISSWRSTGFVTNEQTTGVKINGNSAMNITAYPNPVTDVLTLEVTGGRLPKGTASIIDITGKAVNTYQVTQLQTHIDMSALPAGVYMLRYKDADDINIIRVVKQ